MLAKQLRALMPKRERLDNKERTTRTGLQRVRTRPKTYPALRGSLYLLSASCFLIHGLSQDSPPIKSMHAEKAGYAILTFQRSSWGKTAPISDTASSSVMPVFSESRGAQSSIIASMVVS